MKGKFIKITYFAFKTKPNEIILLYLQTIQIRNLITCVNNFSFLVIKTLGANTKCR